jgi:cell division septum initiation protein DivIVA
MKDLEKELEKSVWEIIIDLQREIRELEEENKKLKKELEYYKNKSSRQDAVIKIAAM